MGALKDGVLLEGGHGLLLLNTAKAGLRVIDTGTEINSTVDLAVVLTSLAFVEAQPIGIGNSQKSKEGNKYLKENWINNLKKE